MRETIDIFDKTAILDTAERRMAMRLLKISEAAKLMGVQTRTLKYWHDKGQFQADVVYPSGHRFYDAERVLEYKKKFTEHRKGAHTKTNNQQEELGL